MKKLAFDFTVQITPIIEDDEEDKNVQLYTSRVKNNKFKVFGKNTSFFWLVHGKRNDIEVEPNKKDTNVRGNGPYTWIG